MIPEFHHALNGKVIDVNEIHVGIEYTAKLSGLNMMRIPQAAKGLLPKDFLPASVIDLSRSERMEILRNIASSLKRHLGLPKETPIKENVQLGTGDQHGHGLHFSVSLPDSRYGEQHWRVDWDGLLRKYDEDGRILLHTVRGGVIELVTPKFLPSPNDIKAVFQSFRENSAVPHADSGGGHINVDLQAFQDRPRALSRFLALFHVNRELITALFQGPKRLRSARPCAVPSSLQKKLADFNGSADELKSLLYNARYFNTQLGRKTRYQQIDVTSYFQDVIPEEFISQDFDIHNPTVLWRQQFRVAPEIRKMELRLFDAPLNAHESALQLKFVRALLNKAFNEDAPIKGNVQNVTSDILLRQPQKILKDLQKLCLDLGFHEEEYLEYRKFLEKRQALLQCHLSAKARTTQQRPQVPRLDIANWGQAVPPRDFHNGLKFSDRPWQLSQGKTLSPILPEALEYQRQRIKKKAQERQTDRWEREFQQIIQLIGERQRRAWTSLA